MINLTRMAGKKNHALALLELLLVLVVAAVIMFTAVKLYINARENSNVSLAVNRVDSVVNASYKWLEGVKQINFCGASSGACPNPITLDKLIKLKLINPKEAESPWPKPNPQVSLAEYTTNPRFIIIRYQAIPLTACRKLAEKLKAKVQIINNQPQIGCQTIPGGSSWYGVF